MSNTQTMTLTDFLLARIAEDEEVAKDAALAAGGVGYGDERIARGSEWVARYHEVCRPIRDGQGRRTIADAGGFVGLSVAPHIARHDPARVLAEVAAKRQIIESVDVLTEGEKDYLQRLDHTDREDARYQITRDILLFLALPYVDHPDYRDEWRLPG